MTERRYLSPGLAPGALIDRGGAGQVDDAYGTCSVCGNAQRLTARGNLYQHQKRDQDGYATGEQCAGAGKPPAPESSPGTGAIANQAS